MPRISTPSTPTTTTPTSTTNLSQTVLNSSKAQPNHHLHNHYHYPLHLQSNNSHQQQQSIHRNHSHVNGMTTSHIRNRNNINVPHKTIALNNNNYQFRTDAGICAYGQTKPFKPATDLIWFAFISYLSLQFQSNIYFSTLSNQPNQSFVIFYIYLRSNYALILIYIYIWSKCFSILFLQILFFVWENRVRSSYI